MPPHLPVPNPGPPGCWSLDCDIMDRAGRLLNVGAMISDALLGPHSSKYIRIVVSKVVFGVCSFADFVRDEYQWPGYK